MDFTNLNYFRTAARYGNLSRAAKELYISQPGLSRYLSRLEEEIGVPLFDRRKGKISLNTYGQLFLANVELAFSQLDQGIDSIRQLYDREQNILSVACSIEDYLVDQLKVFSPTHPEIAIRQFSYSLSEMEDHLLKNDLDFALCTGPFQNDKLTFESISDCPYVLACHQNNPLAKKEAIYLAEAAGQPFLCESARLSPQQLKEICQKDGFLPRISHEIENGYILVNLLEAETGVALVPLIYSLKIDYQTPGHHLRFINLKNEGFPRAQIGAAMRKDHKLSESEKLFLDFLHRQAANESYFLKSAEENGRTVVSEWANETFTTL